MESEGSRPPPDPVIGRLLRRRKRSRRISRSYQGKVYQSWGRFAPKTLQTTGDYSLPSRWGFIVLFFVAILVGPALFEAGEVSSPAHQGVPFAVRFSEFFAGMVPYLKFAAVMLLLLGILRLLSGLIVVFLGWRDRRRN